MSVWLLRMAWASLPITAGPAAADALDGWSTGPQIVAAVLLWSAWGVVLTGVLTPRPVALTAVRVAAPGFFVLAVVAGIFGDAAGVTAVAAIVVTGAAVVLAVTPGVAMAAANGVAYGDERRFPLKTPRVLLLGPLPPAPLLVGAGIAAGPLLVAADRPVVGALALVVGIPVAALMVRALHGLSRRWVVLVPAGLVVVDPLTLPDPVLFLREHIASLRAADPGEPLHAGVVDLRLGALADSLALTLGRETEFLATRRGVRGSVPATTTELRFAAVRSGELLAEAAQRRIPVPTA
ncbi:MAG: hypothetical protein ACR2IR_13460 [Acidimicrobiia bacterium]